MDWFGLMCKIIKLLSMVKSSITTTFNNLWARKQFYKFISLFVFPRIHRHLKKSTAVLVPVLWNPRITIMYCSHWDTKTGWYTYPNITNTCIFTTNNAKNSTLVLKFASNQAKILEYFINQINFIYLCFHTSIMSSCHLSEFKFLRKRWLRSNWKTN